MMTVWIMTSLASLHKIVQTFRSFINCRWNYLQFIMRKRQTRFNYGERCRPVSLDAYSLESVSAYNSVRRKGVVRLSKRSYGNPTFEDSVSCINFFFNIIEILTRRYTCVFLLLLLLFYNYVFVLWFNFEVPIFRSFLLRPIEVLSLSKDLSWQLLIYYL